MTSRTALWLLFALLVSWLMPSQQSLWIDEGQTWRFVRLDSFGELVSSLFTSRWSEAQMPAGMIYHWLMGRLLGDSEWALRAANLPWIWAAIAAFCFVGKLFQMPWLPALFVIQPFVWIYANEARPYCMQIGLGAWIWLAYLRFQSGDRPRTWLAILIGLCWVLCATSLLGTFYVFAVSLLIVFTLLQRRAALCSFIPVLVGGMILFLPLGLYYLRTLLRGAGGAIIWDVGLQNVAFAAYEFLGFTGLGPPRQDLREMGRSGLGALIRSLIPNIPFFLALVVAAIGTFVVSLPRLRETARRVSGLQAVFCICVTTLALFAAALVVGFPFWGRHLAPVFPVFVILEALVIAAALRARLALALFSIGVGCTLLIVSSLTVRYSAIHKKDDYRSAAEAARAELDAGRSVAWFADRITGRYYNLPEITFQDFNPPVTLPDRIFLSKPDVYDRDGSIRAAIEARSYQAHQKFHSFTMFAPAETLPSSQSDELTDERK